MTTSNLSCKAVLQWYEPGVKSVTDEIITHTYIEEVCFWTAGWKMSPWDRRWGRNPMRIAT